MDLGDIQLLASEETTGLLRAHAGEDPVAFALGYKGSEIPGHLLATQLDLRRRALGKLPEWVASGCLFTERALEQASSEVACGIKFEGQQGRLAVDLTGGLGADVRALAQHFERVLYVDADPILCALARVNFQRLGLENVEVRHAFSEEVVENWTGEAVDFVYADPDRRDAQGKRQIRLQDCSPNILALLPQVSQRMGGRTMVMLKASPMLDVAALDAELKELGMEGKVTVVSIGNEVKEMLAEIGEGSSGLVVKALRGEAAWEFSGKLGDSGVELGFFPAGNGSSCFVYELDAAFYKARLTEAFFSGENGWEGGMNFADGYFFSEKLNLKFPGRVFRLLESAVFKPKSLQKRLRELGIEKALLSRRHFDLPLQQIEQKLRLKAGGERYLLLTRHPKGERMALLAERLDRGMA